MAKLQRILRGDFDSVLHRIEDGILRGSISARLEDSSDFSMGDVRISAITAGGSTAMFFKLNTFGEEAFLEKLKELL